MDENRRYDGSSYVHLLRDKLEPRAELTQNVTVPYQKQTKMLQDLLLPGESAVLTLTVDIDGEMAAELNQFRPKLETTLILHVALGKDHFVPVSGNYGAFFSPLTFCWGIYSRASIVLIRADVLREHAFLLDAPQGSDKEDGVGRRPAVGRGR